METERCQNDIVFWYPWYLHRQTQYVYNVCTQWWIQPVPVVNPLFVLSFSLVSLLGETRSSMRCKSQSSFSQSFLIRSKKKVYFDPTIIIIVYNYNKKLVNHNIHMYIIQNNSSIERKSEAALLSPISLQILIITNNHLD
jgi:hypothetical protein